MLAGYCNSRRLISLKPGVTIGRTCRKNWLTFGGDPVPDTDFGSLLHFPHRCGIGDLRRLISISHSHWPIFTTLGEMTDTYEIMNPLPFGIDPADIQINLAICIWILDHFWLTFWYWWRFMLSEHSLVIFVLLVPAKWVVKNTFLATVKWYIEKIVS